MVYVIEVMSMVSRGGWAKKVTARLHYLKKIRNEVKKMRNCRLEMFHWCKSTPDDANSGKK